MGREEQRALWQKPRGNLICRLPLPHAAPDSCAPGHCLAGSEHPAKPTKELPGPEEQKSLQEATGTVNRPVRCGRNCMGLCCVTSGKFSASLSTFPQV